MMKKMKPKANNLYFDNLIEITLYKNMAEH